MYSFSLTDERVVVIKRGNSFNKPTEFLAGSVEYEAFKYLMGINLRLAKQYGKETIVESSEGLFNHIHRNDKLEN